MSPGAKFSFEYKGSNFGELPMFLRDFHKSGAYEGRNRRSSVYFSFRTNKGQFRKEGGKLPPPFE